MKNFISIFLCLAMLLTLCGCFDNAKSGGETIDAVTNETSDVVSLTSSTATDLTSSQNEIVIESSSISSSSIAQLNESTKTSAPQKVESTTTIVSSKQSESSKTTVSQNTTCSHKNTVVKNMITPTCIVTGYTGDVYCTDCNKKIKLGSLLYLKGHANTVIKNQKKATEISEGYTGDEYCNDCNKKISSGVVLPKLQGDMVIYTDVHGCKYTVDKNTDITEYTMHLNTKTHEGPFREVELEILRLCNEERAKVGVSPLTWYEDAHYFAHIRAEEACSCWSHDRPNGTKWSTVYTDANVIFNCCYGENLAQFQGVSLEDVPKQAVTAWMNSEGHKNNILNPEFHKISLALAYDKNHVILSAAEHFFG
jgi:uncharacterized protein YkwD